MAEGRVFGTSETLSFAAESCENTGENTHYLMVAASFHKWYNMNIPSIIFAFLICISITFDKTFIFKRNLHGVTFMSQFSLEKITRFQYTNKEETYGSKGHYGKTAGGL